MTPGSVVLVNFPFHSRAEQPYKRRPVVVLGDRGGRSVMDRAILVAMITGNPKLWRSPGPYDVKLVDYVEHGLERPCVVRAHRLWTAEASDMSGTQLGELPAAVLEQVRGIVRPLVG